jgi:hypothetical protein
MAVMDFDDKRAWEQGSLMARVSGDEGAQQ